MREQFKQGFSLMEMMVVLLIVAIIAAATAPMVSKKMARNAGSGDSPWVFTGLNNSIAYNMNGSNASALIGTSRYNRGDNGPQYPRLVLASGNDGQHPAFAFADANGNFSGQINMNQASGIVAMNNAAVGNNSTAIGMGQTIEGSPSGIVAIGQGVEIDSDASSAVVIGQNSIVSGAYGIAIGNSSDYALNPNTTGAGEYSIAIGSSARASGARSIAIGAPDQNFGATPTQAGINANAQDSIAIGTATYVSGNRSVALGRGAWVNTSTTVASNTAVDNAVAIGYKATARYNNSVAIGTEAETTTTNQIVLGRQADTVYIPGNLVVRGDVALGSSGHNVYASVSNESGRFFKFRYKSDGTKVKTDNWYSSVSINGKSYYASSDRRLKNVGEKYTAGLAELKKLDFFHYTFKKDEAKTPHVGVMAQDLQKVFPDAVTKGEDGYLRIRWEDMFYAVINAVKELDNKITEIVNNITQINSVDEKQNQTIAEQQKTIEQLKNDNAEQQKMIAEQQKLIKNLEKRIEKLEG